MVGKRSSSRHDERVRAIWGAGQHGGKVNIVHLHITTHMEMIQSQLKDAKATL